MRRTLSALILLSLGAAQPAAAKTIELRAHFFCKQASGSATGFCGFASQADLEAAWYANVGEVNLEYDGPHYSGFSFHADVPVIHNDGTDWGDFDAKDDLKPTQDAQDILDALPSDGITITIWEVSRTAGWTSVTCPPDLPRPIVYMTYSMGMPAQKQDNTLDGTAWAHEIGHLMCLSHTHSFVDPAQSDGDNNYEDRDGDDEEENVKCAALPAVTDTPGDCGPAEVVDPDPSPPLTEFDLPADGYEFWMSTQSTDVDPDSPHDSFCTASNVKDDPKVLFIVSPDTNTALSMSYFQSQCKGPFVRDGVRTQAFSIDQVVRMKACDQDADGWSFPDYCGGAGGDTDGDGWCNDDDVCQDVPEAFPVDSDGDGIPDPCDLCNGEVDPSNLDTDGDGEGDICDDNDDNDICTDLEDLNDTDAEMPVGPEYGPNCPEQSHMVSENEDSDGDGYPNCADDDDDNDKIKDVIDPCPIEPGMTCEYWGPACDLPDLARMCAIIPCWLDWEWLHGINPPDRTHVTGRIYAVGDDLLLVPPATRTLSETARAVSAPGPRAEAHLRIYAGGPLVADLGVFAVPEPTTALPLAGKLVRLALDHRSRSVTRSAAWTRLADEASLPDADRDAVPDVVDLCLGTFDPQQRDRDRDRVGDACDFDVDGDQVVTERDVAWVEACVGAAAPDGPQVGAEPQVSLPMDGAYDAWQACAPADLNRDDAVDRADLALVSR